MLLEPQATRMNKRNKIIAVLFALLTATSMIAMPAMALF